MLFNWQERLDHLEPLKWRGQLPRYAALFVLENIGPFRVDFCAVTLLSIASYVTRFAGVFLLGKVISEIDVLSWEQILYYLLPLWLLSMLLAESFDFFTRRYSEALPQVFSDYCATKFELLYARQGSHRLVNISKEKLLALTSRYLGHVSGFVSDWIWSISGKLTELIIVVCVLGWQSPLVLAFNLTYVVGFLALAFYISARFSSVARILTQKGTEAAALNTGFLINLNLVRRLGLQDFMQRVSARALEESWHALDRVRSFHAKRWFLQLNLFNALFLGTLAYAIFQIKHGALALGHLVLLKWAFDRLWQILVYAIEYFVSLVQQREDSKLLSASLNDVLCSNVLSDAGASENFVELELKDINVRFTRRAEDDGVNVSSAALEFSLSIPQFKIRAGEKIGIVGPSGAGKSTFFALLLRQVPYQGEYLLNRRALTAEAPLPLDFMSSVHYTDPFFKISVRDNLLLGANLSDESIHEVLSGVCADDFCRDLDLRIGSKDFNLSSGQEQRLRLARAMLCERDVYLVRREKRGNAKDCTLLG